jgi:hypothetical protein
MLDAPIGYPKTHQKKAYTGTAAAIDNATSAQTRVIRVVLTSAGYIAIGSAPTATASDIYMPANVPEYFVVPPSIKVSAIQDSAGGNLHVTEIV